MRIDPDARDVRIPARKTDENAPLMDKIVRADAAAKEGSWVASA